MFTEKNTKKLQKQLDEIHKELCLSLNETEHEIWWPTPFYINANEYEFRESYDIFNGNCGIVLFFLTLYQYDRNEAHLKVVDKAMHRILNGDAIREPKFFALYTGLGGIIYTCLKVFEVTDNIYYKEKALNLALSNQKQLTEGLLKTDILSGYSGNLFMLSLLYHHADHIEVLNMVAQLIDRLIVEARISEQGLKWDYSSTKKAYDSMTGFSHGASGIAWVLMQIGQYFDATGLIYLAEEALKYEMQYYHAPATNWLDLRLGPHRLNKPDVHKWELQTFLPEMTDVNAWAHGAAGIGLTRQKAFNLTKKENYKRDCKNVLKRCLNDLVKFNRTDFTLVSGYAGMIPFLLNSNESEASKETKVAFILNQAAKLSKRTKSYNTYVSCGADDFGLLSGKAGIGYMILHTLMDNDSDNILKPELPKRKRTIGFSEKYNEEQIKRSIFSRYYKRTLTELTDVDLSIFTAENIDDFKTRLSEEILKSYAVNVKAVFNLENNLIDLWKQHKGYFSFEQRHKHLRKVVDECLSKSDQDLMGRFFKLNDHIKLYRSDQFGEHEALLLVGDENGIKEINIGVFPTIILNAIEKEGMGGNDVNESLCTIFLKKNITKKHLLELQDKIVQQIRLLIKAGFIEVI